MLNKLLKKEIQTKSTSDVNPKEIQRKLKKKGINCSIEEIERQIREYSELLIETRLHKIYSFSFISSLVILLLLAIESELRKLNIWALSDIDHILLTIMGFLAIGILWLRYWLQTKKKYKLSRIAVISTIVILIGITIAMCII